MTGRQSGKGPIMPPTLHAPYIYFLRLDRPRVTSHSTLYLWVSQLERSFPWPSLPISSSTSPSSFTPALFASLTSQDPTSPITPTQKPIRIRHGQRNQPSSRSTPFPSRW